VLKYFHDRNIPNNIPGVKSRADGILLDIIHSQASEAFIGFGGWKAKLEETARNIDVFSLTKTAAAPS
jgi:hypothetical protein